MAWFKNMIAYRLGAAARAWTAPHLVELLAAQEFKPCGDLSLLSVGWAPPFEGGGLAYAAPGGHVFAALCAEEKKLPKQVIDRKTRERCAELEDQQGFRPGRRQTKEVRERVVDELLPRAFTLRAMTRVWIDPAEGWLVVDTPNANHADDVVKMLLKTIDRAPLESWRVYYPPALIMTNWLENDEAPHGFTVDQDAELRATGESRATVRFIRHTLDPDDLRRHIAAGKQCTRLAMTWDDRISFVLTDSLVIKRLEPLDVLKEGAAAMDDQDRRDSDLALMTGELRRLLADLTESLGGEASA